MTFACSQLKALRACAANIVRGAVGVRWACSCLRGTCRPARAPGGWAHPMHLARRLAGVTSLGLCTAASAADTAPFSQSVQVDPAFAYYTDRSAASIAEELKANGYKSARYIVVRESTARRDLVGACHAAGLYVSYATLGNGVYSTLDLPRGWERWKMRVKDGEASTGSFTYLCMNHPEYRRWKKKQVVTTLKRIPFDGFEIMESFWPAYNGPASPLYGCLCDHCRAAFLRANPAAKTPPDFTHADAADYYRKDPHLYEQWIQFRAASVAAFLDDIVNGAEGVRMNFPRLPVAVWGIADAIPDGVAKIREWEGIDGALLVRTVRPELYVIQTDWPDWTRADLAPAYVEEYGPFVRAVAAVSNVPIQVQTDIGSNEQCRRGVAWLSQCQAAARRAGFAGVVAYEYHLSRDIYEAPPRPALAMGATNTITLVFDKRLNAAAAAASTNYTVTPGRVMSITVDGNLVNLQVTDRPTQVTVRGLADDPARRFFKGHAAVTMPSPVTLPVAWR